MCEAYAVTLWVVMAHVIFKWVVSECPEFEIYFQLAHFKGNEIALKRFTVGWSGFGGAAQYDRFMGVGGERGPAAGLTGPRFASRRCQTGPVGQFRIGY